MSKLECMSQPTRLIALASAIQQPVRQLPWGPRGVISAFVTDFRMAG